MTTKVSSPAVRDDSPAVRLVIAEDLRSELDGKVSAVGLYPDHVIVVPMPPGTPDPTEEEPLLLRSLGFLVNISGLKKEVTVSISLGANGALKQFLSPQVLPFQELGKSVNLVGVLVPCVITSFGMKSVVVKIDDTSTTFPFEVRRSEKSLSPPRSGLRPATVPKQLPNLKAKKSQDKTSSGSTRTAAAKKKVK